MSLDRQIGGLSGSLLEIVSDPDRVADLYATLGEFCHKYRNRLNHLKLGFYLAGEIDEVNRDRWKEAESLYNAIEQTMERLHGLCRPIRLETGRFDLALLLSDRRQKWAKWGLRLDIHPPGSPAVGSFDPSQLGNALDCWAASRSGASMTRVSWTVIRGRFQFDWEESGDPACPVDADDLALPLLSRVASLHDGTCRVSTNDGLRVSLSWPTGEPTEAGPTLTARSLRA